MIRAVSSVERQIQPTTDGDLEVNLAAGDAVWLTATPEIQPMT